ncbi:MAG: hypothetical protein B6D45_00020, partial [Ignavibacteriales bacterium UTCHB3]
KDYRGLIAELWGKKTGICGGIGSSQHTHKDNYMSSGVQGGIVPIATGMAFAKKLSKTGGISVVFIGDGTLGEGVVYESLNMASLWNLPVLVVCENNFYALSTPIKRNMAGEIADRFKAFNIKTLKTDVWNQDDLFAKCSEAINYVREEQKPAFLQIDLYRLNSPSTGRDSRESDEVAQFVKKDPINLFAAGHPEEYKEMVAKARTEIDAIIADVANDPELSIEEYGDEPMEPLPLEWSAINFTGKDQVESINEFFHEEMAHNDKILIIGEDVAEPFGGGFGVSSGIEARFPERIYPSPISEAGITGIGNGLGLMGYKPFVEIMFGDFVTLTFDQLLNHAAKFHRMYNKATNCGIVLRTPMGGFRGYGPTHSQSLEKYFIGMDDLITLSLNIYTDPKALYKQVLNEELPVVLFENKLDYKVKHNDPGVPGYVVEHDNGKYPAVRFRPGDTSPDLTIAVYGGLSGTVVSLLNEFREQHDLTPEVIVLTQLYPMDLRAVIESVARTNTLVTVEEGKKTGGIGAEIIAEVQSHFDVKIDTLRIGAENYPIPSPRALEDLVLPGKEVIRQKIVTKFAERIQKP